MAKRLCFLDPGDTKTFKRLDALRSMVLHADEDYETVAWCLDTIFEDAKKRRKPKGCYLLLNEPLGRLGKCPLDLTDADGCGAWVKDAFLYECFGEEVGLPAAPASVRAFVASWRKEWLEDTGSSDAELLALRRRDR